MRVPLIKPPEWIDSAGHTLAVAHTALAAYLDLQDRLAGGGVVDDRHVPKFEIVRFVGAKSGIGHEQHIVVELRCRPLPGPPVLHGVSRAPTRRGVQALVFVR